MARCYRRIASLCHRCAVLFCAVYLLTGCVTTYTQAEAPDGTELTILRVGFAGGFKGHGADASFVGPSGARLTVGDLAEDISVDPEVAGAIAQGATAAVIETIKRIGMPVL